MRFRRQTTAYPERTADAAIVLNGGSGDRNKGPVVEQLRRLREKFSVNFDLVIARGGPQIKLAARHAIRSGYKTVIGGGGDGTLNAVASEVVGTDANFGVLPLGTFNHFAQGIGVPLDLEAALRVALEGEVQSTLLGHVNGQIFLNNASLGLYPAMLKQREETYDRWGRSRIAAYGSGLLTLLRHGANMRLTIDTGASSEAIRTPMVFIARSSYQLQQFQLPGHDEVAAGQFAVFVLPPVSRTGLVRAGLRMMTRSLEPFRDFHYFCSPTLMIGGTRRSYSVAFDGEKARMDAPLRFEMKEKLLHLRVPKAGAGVQAA